MDIRGVRMIEWRHTMTLAIFFGVCFGIIYHGLTFKDESLDVLQSEKRARKVRAESYLKKIDYFLFDKGDPFLYLNAESVSIDSEGEKTSFTMPYGKIYSPSKIEVNYSAESGSVNEKSSVLYLQKNVEIKSVDSNLVSNELTYNHKKDELFAKGNVKTTKRNLTSDDTIEVNSDTALTKPKAQISNYTGNVTGRITRKKAYESPITFGSNILNLDHQQYLVRLEESVWVKRENVHATSLRGEIYLENYNKKLKYYTLFDDVKVSEIVRTKKGETFKREAFAERLEGIISEAKIVLTGYPKVYQERDVIKGNRIVLFEDSEVVEVDDANTSFRID